MNNKKRIFVCGDTHFTMDLPKLKIEKWQEQENLTKNDILIQLGDFGFVWYPLGTNEKQEYWLNWISCRKYTLLVVPGNHENYTIIEALPECEMFNGKVKYLKTSGVHGEGIVYFAKRGEVYTINNKTFWAFGGALSIDKDSRISEISYWEKELPNYEEYEYGLQQLDRLNWNVDYVISHTCPVDIIGNVIKKTVYTEGKYKDPITIYFKEISQKLKFKEWHFGHFHTDIRLDYSETNNGIFQCHYNKVPFEID